MVLELPDDLKVADLAYLTIWCRRFSVTFGTILLNGKNGENDSATCADSKAANLPASVRGASAVALVQLLLFRKLPQL